MIAQDIHIAKTLTFYAITFLSLVDCFKLINFIYWIKKKVLPYLLRKIELRVEYSE